MEKTIVLATDLQATSAQALERSLLMARDQGTTVTAIHVVEPVPSRAFTELLPRVRALADERFAELTERGRQAGVEVRCRFEEGKPFTRIIARARELDASLIVTGPHVHETLREIFLGSTTHRLVRKSDRPVLVARLGDPMPYRRAMVMVDLSDGSRRALRAAHRLLPADCELHVFFCYQIPHYLHPVLEIDAAAAGDALGREWREVAERDLEAFLAETDLAGRTVHTHLVAGTPVEAALQVVERAKIQLVVTGSHGRSDLNTILLGSVAEGVMATVPCDVMVVPPNRRQFELP